MCNSTCAFHQDTGLFFQSAFERWIDWSSMRFVQMLYSTFMCCNCDIPKFRCGLVEDFPILSKSTFEFIIPIQNSFVWGCVLLNHHTTKHRSRFIPKDDMRVSLSTTVPCSKVSCIVQMRIKQTQNITAWLAGWKCLSCYNKIKTSSMIVYSFRTFFSWTQWYAGSYEIVLELQEAQQTIS